MRRPIRVLPPHVAARIAAGEVVERPASVAKELLENAIDAGARRVSVSMPGDPTAVLSVTDDGCGVPREELAEAFARHATSKLAGDGVRGIDTLGFRGEALPSVAAFATVRMQSRTAGEEHGWEVTADASGVGEPRPSGIPVGTKVEVRDLFGAHPARLKFMKTKRTEASKVREAFDLAALTRPDVEFRLDTQGGTTAYRARTDDPEGFLARIADVMGAAFGPDCVPVLHVAPGVRVTGGACVPTRNRRDGAGIVTLSNGRPVTSRCLSAAVRAAYAGLLPPGAQPCAVVAVEVDPDDVDVNVHPRKSDVRFREEGAVCRAVTEAVRLAVSSAGLRTTAALGELAAALAVPAQAVAGDRRRLPLGRFVGQCNGAWLICETMDGLAVVDQHAAHERVVLERLREALAGAAPSSRPLPSPVRVALLPGEAAALSDRREALEAVGYRIEVGEGFAEATHVPAAIGHLDPAAVLAELASKAAEDPHGPLDVDAQALALSTAACHAAIKAGDSLDAGRADRLLREIEATPNAAQCNHGRPTFVHLDGAAIERLFARR